MNNLLKPDKAWFDRHPGRRYRFRLTTPEERLAYPGAGSIALHLLDNGDVMRLLLEVDRPAPEAIEQEQFGRIYFNFGMSLQEFGVNKSEAMNRALLAEVNHEKS